MQWGNGELSPQKEMHSYILEKIEGNQAVFSKEERTHMAANRLRAGEEFLGIDNTGFEYLIRAEGPKDGPFVVLEKRRSDKEPGICITLYQAFPKSSKIDLALQKGVELGLSKFVPFLSARCVKRPDASSKVCERLRKVAAEATKQCGRAIVPEVSDLLEFEEVAKRIAGHELPILCYEEETARSIKEALSANRTAKDIAILIGPEGGFEPWEAEQLKRAGAHSVTLGKRILRTETAGMAAVSMALYEMDEVGR